MLEEFKRALVKGELLDAIADTLKHNTELIAKRRIDEIERDLSSAKYIECGLRQPQDTIPHQIALGFIREYKQETGEHIQRSIEDRLADNAGKEEKAND